MLYSIDPGKRPRLASRVVKGPKALHYQLYLGEIDELMHRLFSVAGFNFAAFTGHLNLAATKYLYEQNEAFRAE